jgi:hypothetical protein
VVGGPLGGPERKQRGTCGPRPTLQRRRAAAQSLWDPGSRPWDGLRSCPRSPVSRVLV